MFITKSWELISLCGIIGILISVMVVPWYIPESPKFYYENNNFDLARKSLLEIARHNKVLIMDDIKFDKEEK